MQHNVIYIGSQFRNNAILYEYTQRAIKKALGVIDQIHFFDENDKRLFLALESLVGEESKLLVLSSKSAFTSVGKLLSTLTGDIQILKDGMLLPSKTDVYADNSYLVRLDQTQVNVVQVQADHLLPDILFEEQKHVAFLHVFGSYEDEVKLMFTPLADSVDVTLRVQSVIEGWHSVEIGSSKYGELASFITSAKSLLPHKVIATSDVFAYIIERLYQEEKKVTMAESCTGGLIATLFTKISGSSAVFDGSIVSYSNEKKVSWLGVDEEILENYGAVSRETVLAMSKGAKEVADADYAIAVSGIAGPTGATEGKPVGLVYVSICNEKLHEAYVLHLQGDRNYIQQQAAYHAVKQLILSDKELFF